ncbi:MAG: hypothetical protein RL011_1726 [Pseudomonadota bacterium]
MKIERTCNLAKLLGLSLVVASHAEISHAASHYTTSKYGYLFDLGDISTALEIPLRDNVETVAMPRDIMQERLEKAASDPTVEPLTVVIGNKPVQIAALAAKLAKTGKKNALKNYFTKKLEASPAAKLNTDPTDAAARTITLDKESFGLIDPVKLGGIYAKPQHNLIIQGDGFKNNQRLTKNFMRELVPFFDTSARAALRARLQKGENLEVNIDLLPEFAKSMLKKYIIFRGPNCFHAALAFQSVILPSSSFINVKEEPGYHRAMINYDELWRTIATEFYEIDPSRQALKYGDMLVFFDVPERQSDQASTEIDFHWIRHTATHLVNGFTFSKGSKSPNTPYTVRTLKEEWDTWKKFTKNLGLRVFRRSLTKVNEKPPVDLIDWVY